ncbi:hypothetical protein [Streptomyces sp. NPDC005953]|uniref:hypothetical protein n=1 Tax=Streptomyces sp. NPDC005953 TaxID=3156719 RepID=UPI0033C67D3F
MTNTTTTHNGAYRTPASTIPAGDNQNKHPSSPAFPEIMDVPELNKRLQAGVSEESHDE